MDKLLLIIKREYLAKVRNKSFVIMTFLSPFLMVGMVVLVAYLTQMNDSDQKVITLLNQSDFYKNDFTSSDAISYLTLKDITLEEAKDSTAKMGFYGLLYIPKSELNIEESAFSTHFITKESPSTSIVASLEAVFQNRLRISRLHKLGVTEAQYTEMDKEFSLKTETFSGHQNLKGINEIKAVIGGAFGYLIMMFIIIYGGFVMRSVIEEKTSRIIEVIISSVKPFQLMLGKIIGTSLAGITQFIIWIISGGLLLLIASVVFGIDIKELKMGPALATGAVPELAVLNETPDIFRVYASEILQLPWGLMLGSFVIYFILGYFIYSSIYAAIGAAVDNETDTQQFMLPVILPLMLAIYIGFFSVFNNPHGPIAVVFSLFPLTSPIVMLMRLPAGLGEGGVPYWEFFTSIGLLIISFLAIVWLAAKIYRVGILMYGKKPTYRELYKWLKY